MTKGYRRGPARAVPRTGGVYYWDQESRTRDARFVIDEFRTLEGDPGPQLQLSDVFASQRCMDLLGPTNPITNPGGYENADGDLVLPSGPDDPDTGFTRPLLTCQGVPVLPCLVSRTIG